MHYRTLWVGALAGMALHLAGLGWDVYRHSSDATLAQREDVLSLANPSHLMIVAGTAIVAACLLGIAVAWLHERRFGGDGPLGAFLRGAGMPAIGVVAAGSIWLASQADERSHHHDAGHVHGPSTVVALDPAIARALDPRVAERFVAAAGHEHGSGTGGEPLAADAAGHHHAEVPVTAEQLASAAAFVAELRTAVAPYEDIRAALAAGYIQVTQDLPGIAAHFLRLDFQRDGHEMDPARPEVLLYTKRLDGQWRLVGAMFLAEGFTEDPPSYFGPLDAWHYHENLCFVGSSVRTVTSREACPGIFSARTPWQLHVWTYPTVGGVFAHDMPEIAPGSFPGAALPAAQELAVRAR